MFAKTTALAFLATLALASAGTLTDWTDGIATHYGGAQEGMDPNNPSYGTKEGSCGYGKLDKNTYPFWQVGAFATSNKYFKSIPGSACGTCWEIQCVEGKEFKGRCRDGGGKSVVVTITDSCPECGADHMDLQALVFDKLAPMALGRINMRYRRVDCTPPSGSGMGMKLDHNFGPGGWVRLLVDKAAGSGSIKSVQVKGSDGAWRSLSNTYGTAWEISSAPSLPWDFKFVSDDGQEVTATKVVDSGGKVGDHPTNVQFSLSKGGQSNSGRKMLDQIAPEVAAKLPRSNAGFGGTLDVKLPANVFEPEP